MQVKLTKPEIERFITERVRAGDFPTAQAVVENAMTRMMQEKVDMTDEDVDAIVQAEDQIDRGESVDFDSFTAKMRRKFGVK